MSLPELVAELTTPIGDAIFGYVDLETTDLFLNGSDGPHRIVEVGAVLTNSQGTVLDSFSSLVQPDRSIPNAASAVHGLTDADVADAPRWEKVQGPLLTFLSRASMVFGFNSPFDLRFIIHEMLLKELSPPRMEFFDVARMANRAGFGRCSLVDLCYLLDDSSEEDTSTSAVPTLSVSSSGASATLTLSFGGSGQEDADRDEHSAHRALGDAERTASCMAALLLQGFKPDETLADIKATHDSTVPVYDTARCLVGIDAARRIRSGRSSKSRKEKPPENRVCVTGKLDGMVREQVKARLAAVGYKYVKEASKGPEFIVAGERPAERKIDDAMRANIPVMDGSQFLEWLGAREQAPG